MEASPGPQGIDVDSVTRWFSERTDAVAPLSFELIAGGRSNLTFRVTDSGGRTWVLRRPPLGGVLATAHDMGREHRIISALAGTDVPVAPVVGLEADDAVNGAPFYVMEFVDGSVLRDAADVATVPVEVRRQIGPALAATLARIHAVDPDSVGLGDLGRKEGYIERQLKRWNGQYEKSAASDLPDIAEAHRRLAAAVPAQGAAAIVHGDYRLDNCMVDEAGEVMAVLDWELCTLGDPLADLGLLMVYWTRPGDPFSPLPGAATAEDGFAERSELIAAYEAASGRPVEHLGFYTAFGYWKLACILAGVYTRYKAGDMGDDGASADLFGDVVAMLGRAAIQTLDEAGIP